MTTPWSHLPNAKHIDRVLTSLKSYSEKWEATRDAAWEMAWTAVSETARGTASESTWEAVWYAVWYATRNATRSRARDRALTRLNCSVARGVILALIAYDDCAYMLDSDVNEIKILATLGDPRAILLLPACIAVNSIKEMEIV